MAKVGRARLSCDLGLAEAKRKRKLIDVRQAAATAAMAAMKEHSDVDATIGRE